jgi:acyl-CoA synthetase (NDP forming)
MPSRPAGVLMSDLAALFEPRSVVVVGASNSPGKLGHAMASSLASFAGAVHLVNNRPGPGMYPSVTEAVAASDAAVDLAVMCVPASITAAALRESASAGVRAALVCAGGFAEAGGVGLEYAADLDEVVGETGIRLLGPNTSGFFVPQASLFASFVPGVREFGPGSVAVVAASGGVNHVLSFHLSENGAGVSLGVGVGAGQDVAAPDVLRYLVGHEQTRAVILHVETVPDGRALIAAVEELTAVKPVVALVIGRNDISEFAQSHTGALATSWRTTRAALRQAGAVLVDDEEQAVAAATALAGRRGRPTAHPGVGLITGQAGPGLIIADTLATAGTGVPRLADATQTVLGTLLPPITYQANPVDTGRPGTTFPEIVRAVAGDPAVDILAIYAITEPVVDLPGAIAGAGVDPSMPIALGVDGPSIDVAASRASAGRGGLALLRGPTRLAQGVAALADDMRLQARRLDPVASAEIPTPIEAAGPWDEIRGKDLLDRLGVGTPPRRRCADRDAARRAWAELGGPVAVKLVDPEILHKSDVGGVVLGVADDAAFDDALDRLDAAWAALGRTTPTVYLVERMAAPGVDLVVGARLDPVFGPVVVVGLGGTTTEVLGDVAIRCAPLDVGAATAMVDDLAARRLLDGYRGEPAVDTAELGRIIALLGGLVASGAVAEIEINPLRGTRDGIVALDAVVIPRHHEEMGSAR